MEELTSHLHS